MNSYWAQFMKIEDNIFRFNTRIYLEQIDKPNDSDICIGAVVGKNPGSAQAKDLHNKQIQEILLTNDKLLPSVRSIIHKTYKFAHKEVPKKSYIQVLNLFYLCNPILSNAIKEIEKYSTPKICNSENLDFPWVWYLWGNENIKLSKFKIRFKKLKTHNHFFLDKKTKQIISHIPNSQEFAKHTQGLMHDLLIPYLSHII